MGIQKLMNAKTLTIEKLMELAPEDFVDPSPYLYNTTLYAAAVSYSFDCLYFTLLAYSL